MGAVETTVSERIGSEVDADTTAPEPVRILFVDDEEMVLKSLRRVFRKMDECQCDFSTSPMQALEMIARNRYAVLVCDHVMPQMTGAEFMARIKGKRPHMVRIMLTGQADIEAVVKAINEGEIFRFILKPWDPEDLKNAIRTAVEHHRLAVENKRLTTVTRAQNEKLKDFNRHLEDEVRARNAHLSDALHTARKLSQTLQQSLYSVANAFFSLVELAKPDLGTHSRRVAVHSCAIAAELGFSKSDIKEVEIAALLHDCGKLGFPNFMLEKAVQDYQPKEMRLYTSHPETAVEHLRQLKGYEKIAEYILCHHELMNGEGFPEGRKGSSIPMQAYIIGLMNRYDHLISRANADTHFLHQSTVQTLRNMSGKKYPEKLTNVVVDYVTSLYQASSPDDILKIGLANVAPGMVLANDLYTIGGTLLLATGQKLTQQSIRRVRTIAQVDPILGEIHVYPSRDRR